MPSNSQYPLAHRDHTKSRLQVILHHECTRTVGDKHAYCVIHRGVMEGEWSLRDVVIDAGPHRHQEVEYHAPLVAFLGYCP